MKRLIGKFGRYRVATFIIMAVGLVLFLLTPFFLWLFDFDSDILGVLIFLIGSLMWLIGFIIRIIKSHKRVG
jgi:hypothetical protein